MSGGTAADENGGTSMATWLTDPLEKIAETAATVEVTPRPTA